MRFSHNPYQFNVLPDHLRIDRSKLFNTPEAVVEKNDRPSSTVSDASTSTAAQSGSYREVDSPTDTVPCPLTKEEQALRDAALRELERDEVSSVATSTACTPANKPLSAPQPYVDDDENMELQALLLGEEPPVAEAADCYGSVTRGPVAPVALYPEAHYDYPDQFARNCDPAADVKPLGSCQHQGECELCAAPAAAPFFVEPAPMPQNSPLNQQKVQRDDVHDVPPPPPRVVGNPWPWSIHKDLDECRMPYYDYRQFPTVELRPDLQGVTAYGDAPYPPQEQQGSYPPLYTGHQQHQGRMAVAAPAPRGPKRAAGSGNRQKGQRSTVFMLGMIPCNLAHNRVQSPDLGEDTAHSIAIIAFLLGIRSIERCYVVVPRTRSKPPFAVVSIANPDDAARLKAAAHVAFQFDVDRVFFASSTEDKLQMEAYGALSGDRKKAQNGRLRLEGVILRGVVRLHICVCVDEVKYRRKKVSLQQIR